MVRTPAPPPCRRTEAGHTVFFDRWWLGSVMSTGVTVLLFGPVASSLGRRRVHIDAADVDEVVRAVDAITGGAFGPWVEECRVFVNGEPAGEARLRSLRPGDEVAFLPPSSGG